MRQPAGRSARRSGGERKPREERWAELIEVATEVFYEKGYDGASLQDIADRLGMPKGSLYYYIQSKEDLLFDVISSVHKDGLAVIRARAAVASLTPGRRAPWIAQAAGQGTRLFADVGWDDTGAWDLAGLADL